MLREAGDSEVNDERDERRSFGEVFEDWYVGLWYGVMDLIGEMVDRFVVIWWEAFGILFGPYRGVDGLVLKQGRENRLCWDVGYMIQDELEWQKKCDEMVLGWRERLKSR